MIIRVFRATVQPGMQAAYEKLLREEAVPEISEQSGLVALHVGIPIAQTPDEFVIVTVWKDLESLEAFWGKSWLQSIALPDEAQLVKASSVQGYTTLDDVSATN
jgi:heme-degrading monooxygenase HmoA